GRAAGACGTVSLEWRRRIPSRHCRVSADHCATTRRFSSPAAAGAGGVGEALAAENGGEGKELPVKKARVLIVDDSVVIRRLLTEALANDPAIEVAGAAANGRIALQKIAQLN